METAVLLCVSLSRMGARAAILPAVNALAPIHAMGAGYANPITQLWGYLVGTKASNACRMTAAMEQVSA